MPLKKQRKTGLVLGRYDGPTPPRIEDLDPRDLFVRAPRRVCCERPDIKNEGYVDIAAGRSWSYHCYACDRTWSEI